MIEEMEQPQLLMHVFHGLRIRGAGWLAGYWLAGWKEGFRSFLKLYEVVLKHFEMFYCFLEVLRGLIP